LEENAPDVSLDGAAMTAQRPIDFTAATDPRDLGMQRAVDHANRVESEWSGQALGLFIAYAEQIGKPFLTEDARTWAYAHGLPSAPTDKAWGVIPKRAEAKGRVVRAGSAYSKVNRCLKPTWRYCANGDMK
jgi:hypothetical protein